MFSGFVQDVLSGDQSHLSLENLEHFKENVRLFFRGIGEDDLYYGFFQKDDAFFENNCIICERRIYKGNHEWKVWRRCLYDFVQMIFKENE